MLLEGSKHRYEPAAEVKYPTWHLLVCPDRLPSLLGSPPLCRVLLGFFAVASPQAPCAPPDLTPLPLHGFRTRDSAELGLYLHHAGPDHVTLPAGLVTLRPLGPLGQHAVHG